LECLQGLVIVGRNVVSAVRILQKAVLRTDTRVVKARADAVRPGDLALFVLQNVAAGSVKDPGRSRNQGCGVPSGGDAVTGCLNSNEGHFGVFDKGVKDADGVASA